MVMLLLLPKKSYALIPKKVMNFQVFIKRIVIIMMKQCKHIRIIFFIGCRNQGSEINCYILTSNIQFENKRHFIPSVDLAFIKAFIFCQNRVDIKTIPEIDQQKYFSPFNSCFDEEYLQKLSTSLYIPVTYVVFVFDVVILNRVSDVKRAGPEDKTTGCRAFLIQDT